MDMDMDMDCMDMGMCFAATKKLDHLLFKGWHISSVGEMIGSMVASFTFAFIYETLKAGITYHYSKQPENQEQQPLVSEGHITIKPIGQFHLREHIVKTIIYMSNLIYAYILMLVAMSYNIWLFLALVLGLGAGYFFSQPFFQSFLVPVKTKRTRTYGATSGQTKPL